MSHRCEFQKPLCRSLCLRNTPETSAMLIIAELMWLSAPPPDASPACEPALQVKSSQTHSPFRVCRSISRATPCRALTLRRPHRGLPGRPSTSLTTVATTSSASATPAKLESPTPACWKWGGRGSRCATAPATAPRAAPPMVSANGDRWASSAFRCVCYLTGSLQLHSLLVVFLTLNNPLFSCYLKLFLSPHVLEKLNESWIISLVFVIPSSQTLSVDQSLRHGNELLMHKADQQLTTNCSSPLHKCVCVCKVWLLLDHTGPILVNL